MISSPGPQSHVQLGLVTISDSRDPDTDKSGDLLYDAVTGAGHRVISRQIVRDDLTAIVALFRSWIRDPQIDVVISSGGTGLTGRDVTPEALTQVIDKPIPGFGELFRFLSYRTIGSSALQSRAAAGLAGTTYIFCLPGSPSACRDAWENILKNQLDSTCRPCNLVALMPRLGEREP